MLIRPEEVVREQMFPGASRLHYIDRKTGAGVVTGVPAISSVSPFAIGRRATATLSSWLILMTSCMFSSSPQSDDREVSDLPLSFKFSGICSVFLQIHFCAL